MNGALPPSDNVVNNGTVSPVPCSSDRLIHERFLHVRDGDRLPINEKNGVRTVIDEFGYIYDETASESDECSYEVSDGDEDSEKLPVQHIAEVLNGDENTTVQNATSNNL